MSVGVPGGPPGVPGVPWVIYRTKTKLSAPGIHLSGFQCPVLITKYGKNTKKLTKKFERGVCKGCVQGVLPYPKSEKILGWLGTTFFHVLVHSVARKACR